MASIRELEDFIGFEITRGTVGVDEDLPIDDRFAYNLCMKFYNQQKELDECLSMVNELIRHRLGNPAHMFSLGGHVHYLLGNSRMAAAYFMKSIYFNPRDITPWYELLNVLRTMGEFELFEIGMFNFREMVLTWEGKMSQDRLVAHIKSLGKKGDEHITLKNKC